MEAEEEDVEEEGEEDREVSEVTFEVDIWFSPPAEEISETPSAPAAPAAPAAAPVSSASAPVCVVKIRSDEAGGDDCE